MRYFDHDTNAADDDRVMALRLAHGGEAVDAYWTLLEKIYRDEKPINLVGSKMETESVSHRLCVGSDMLMAYVGTMLEIGLFDGSVENLYSERAMRNIEAYQKKAETARQNGKMGGRKPKQKPTRNRVGSDVGTKKGTESVARKENKNIGFDKQNLYVLDADGACVCDAPPAYKCPLCGTEVQSTGIPSEPYWCDNCKESFAEGKVVA